MVHYVLLLFIAAKIERRIVSVIIIVLPKSSSRIIIYTVPISPHPLFTLIIMFVLRA